MNFKVSQYGNPFFIDHPDLLKLDSQDVFDTSVAETIRTIEQKGEEQNQRFVVEVLQDDTKGINDPIKRNSFPLPSTPLRKETTTAGKKVKEVKNNAALGQLMPANATKRCRPS